jgi:hypothetical protein
MSGSTFAAIVGALLAGLVTFLIAQRQISAARAALEKQIAAQEQLTRLIAGENISVSRAASFMERFSDPLFLPVRDDVELFILNCRDISADQVASFCAQICARGNLQDIRLYNRLHSFCMFFAEIGFAYKRNLIEPEGLAIFDRILPYYWRAMDPYIVACHNEYGFDLDDGVPLHEQELVLFNMFRLGYNSMVERGIARSW